MNRAIHAVVFGLLTLIGLAWFFFYQQSAGPLLFSIICFGVFLSAKHNTNLRRSPEGAYIAERFVFGIKVKTKVLPFSPSRIEYVKQKLMPGYGVLYSPNGDVMFRFESDLDDIQRNAHDLRIAFSVREHVPD